MPFVVPNIPFAPPLTQSGVVTIARAPSASVPTHRLDAAFAASVPSGNAVSLCSLGFDAGAAPGFARSLAVSAPGTTFESALAMVAFPFGGFARTTAGLRVFIEEFTAGGGFIGGFAGPMTTIFDMTVIFGANVRTNTRFLGAFFRQPVVPGRRYRVWVDLVQSVFAFGPATAVSNCTVNVGPNFPPGSPQDILFGGTVFFSFDSF